MENLSNDHKSYSNQYKNSQKLCNTTVHETERTKLDFPIEGKAIAEWILATVELNTFKRAEVRESKSVVQVANLTIWVDLR